MTQTVEGPGHPASADGDNSRRMLRSLRHREFRLLTVGQLASHTGTWMQKVAQAWLVLDLSHGDGTALGVITALQFLPLLLFGPWGGVLADRRSLRRILLITQSVLCLVSLLPGILALTHAVSLPAVYALALAMGLTLVTEKPALQSFIAQTVPTADLPNAVALDTAVFNLARITGPALTGPVIGVFGVAPAFFLNSFSYLVVVAALLRMKPRQQDPDAAPLPTRRPKGQVRELLRYVRGRADLGAPLVLVGVVAGFGMNFQITTALMASDVFHTSPVAFGLGSTAFAAGAVTGSVVAARRGPCGPGYLVSTALGFGVLEVVTSTMPSHVAFLVMLVPTGAVLILFMTAAKSALQLGTHDAIRGRVMSLYTLASLGTTPLTAPLIGWISTVAHPRAGLAVGGLASAVAAMTVGLRGQRHTRPWAALLLRPARSALRAIGKT
ncbi:MFS transporter [Streptomyces sp. NPDC006530]|uniref:MFS transporter n=1 Tax=Streptomyces sp. NPDC006530 TaxID=3364750 RepID=UPI0036C82EAA